MYLLIILLWFLISLGQALDISSPQTLKGTGMTFEVGGPQGHMQPGVDPLGSGMCATGSCG